MPRRKKLTDMAVLRAVATALLLAAVATDAARAAEHHTIVIQHMELESIPGTFRVGDTVTFDNRADMAHNLYVTYDDGTIDNLDTQFTGMKKSVTLRRAGPAKIRCWIHPVINLDMDIAPAADAAKQ